MITVRNKVLLISWVLLMVLFTGCAGADQIYTTIEAGPI